MIDMNKQPKLELENLGRNSKKNSGKLYSWFITFT
jgi:hypothetical protein